MASRRPPENADYSVPDILAWLEAQGSADNIAGMGRFGINTQKAFGVGNTTLRPFARTLGRNHERRSNSGGPASAKPGCWPCLPKSRAGSVRIRLAPCRDDFNSWEIVDHASDLFVDAGHLDELVPEFAADDREFVRRTAFAMIAWAAVHLKKRDDADFIGLLPLIERRATDPRNFVRKAVNWALRQIGKRSLACHAPALALAERLAASQDKTARWIGRDAVRELTDEKTRQRLASRKR
jgi:3-methyladenine DNA glycosylase AlkD